MATGEGVDDGGMEVPMWVYGCMSVDLNYAACERCVRIWVVGG